MDRYKAQLLHFLCNTIKKHSGPLEKEVLRHERDLCYMQYILGYFQYPHSTAKKSVWERLYIRTYM